MTIKDGRVIRISEEFGGKPFFFLIPLSALKVIIPFVIFITIRLYIYMKFIFKSKTNSISKEMP